jgi:cobalt-zinc-cadmium efflux system outer membrane protein
MRLSGEVLQRMAGQMLTNHPALRALAARTRAADHATNGVRTWEDPQFRFGGYVASGRGPSLEEEGNLTYGLEQKLPVFGRPEARRRVASAEADTARARQELQFEMLRRDLARLLFQAAAEERWLELGRQDLAWLEAMSATAEERYRAGTASQVDVLRLQSERARRADRLRTETRQRDQTVVDVNRLWRGELNAPLPSLELPPVAAPVGEAAGYVQLAVAQEPRLRVLAREIQAAEAQVAATRKERLPEVTAGVEGRQSTGDGGFREGLFTVGLSLPWLNAGRYRSDVARDRARVEAAEWEAVDQTQALQAEIRRLVTAIDAARREAFLQRDDLMPRAQLAMESARASWLNGRGLFLDVMEARRMWLESQWTLVRAVAEQHQALSDLALACGLPDFEAVLALSGAPAAAGGKEKQP